MSGMKMRGMNFAYMQLLNVHFSSCDLEVCKGIGEQLQAHA